jgi:hypothetical protein
MGDTCNSSEDGRCSVEAVSMVKLYGCFVLFHCRLAMLRNLPSHLAGDVRRFRYENSFTNGKSTSICARVSHFIFVDTMEII